jgi:ubiquinone/menaquinone biosynthesis C-methylase UbiE
MEFYNDLVPQVDRSTERKYHYHEWTPESIRVYWELSSSNPFIRAQFYPREYWVDLIEWAASRIAPPPAEIADVGCGVGNLLACLRETGFPAALLYGVDLSEEALHGVRARFAADSRIAFRTGSLERLPFADRSIDLVTCTEVLEHTFPETFTKSFGEVSRVLKPGGHYLATVPIEEKVAFVCCPECRCAFTPWQHMMFGITREDIAGLLHGSGMELVAFYAPIDRTLPRAMMKRLAKRAVVRWMPDLARHMFAKAGVSGFLARRARSSGDER